MADDELRSDLANATDPAKGAALVGYATPGTGAIAQTVKDKLDQNIDVRDFGFSPANTASQNQIALSAAIEAAAGRRVVIEATRTTRSFRLRCPLLRTTT